MKNLHNIKKSMTLSDEDKAIIEAWFRNAYLPMSKERRLKFAQGKVFYNPDGTWRDITHEWNSDYWRGSWQGNAKLFHEDMIITE